MRGLIAIGLGVHLIVGCAHTINHSNRLDIAPHIGESIPTTREWAICDVSKQIWDISPIIGIPTNAGCNVRALLPAGTPIKLIEVTEYAHLDSIGLDIIGEVVLPSGEKVRATRPSIKWRYPPW